MLWTRVTKATALALPFAFTACVFYPKMNHYYDADCEIESKKLELQAEVIENANCHGSGDASGACAAILLAIGAGSAIVSGSIVVVGNTIFWLERKGKCIAKSPD